MLDDPTKGLLLHWGILAQDALLTWFMGMIGRLEWTEWAILTTILLIERVSPRLGMWPYAMITLPGTLAHELSHYVTALLLRAQPGFPNLVPQRYEDGWRMGSVTFRADLLRALPIALAPVALAPLSLWYAAHFLPHAPPLLYAPHAWVAATMLAASLPSRADWRLAIPALSIFGIAMAVIWFAR